MSYGHSLVEVRYSPPGHFHFCDHSQLTNLPPTDILDLFVNDSSDLDLFFAKLSAFYSTRLHKRESLIIFDEVQQYPRARQLIKYLVADGRFDYLETGSLIRLKKNVQDIIIP